MYPIVKFLILVLAFGTVLTIGARCDGAAQVKQPPARKFTGVPRDIDFIKNVDWTQVILQDKSPTDALIAQTKNDCIESILLVALSLKGQVTVEYIEDTPKKLTSVTLRVNVKEKQGYVFALSVDEKDNYCRATVFDQGKKVEVWTKSAQMQSILETAVRQSLPVQEFAYDSATMEISRGKINIELRM
ncbi:MAG TPA: hypothetical protein VF088_00575 [Pyrinomonadaceae bacterium]